jgi:hypothetical protein
LGGCTPPSTQDLCNRLEQYEQRCNPGRPACEIEDNRRQCQNGLSVLRSEYVAAIDACLGSEPACGADGGVGSQYASCVCDRIRTVQPTQVQRDAIQAVCDSCPTFNGGTGDSAACVAANSTVGPGCSGTGQGATFTTSVLLLFSDSVAGSIRDCARGAAPGAW